MAAELSAETFPPGFGWGVSIGAHQSEGNNIASDWWYHETQPDSPVAEPCGDAVDSYHRWPDDLDLAASAGFTDYRCGVEWSRIEPADGRISRAEIGHYRRIVEGAVARGLRPTLTLFHFTVPLWFAAGGSWARADAVDRFLGYVDALAPVLDAGVVRVMTVNEPNIYATLPRLGPDGLGTSGLPVPDPDLTRVMIGLHQATVARLRGRHPQIEAGWGVSVQDYQAEPGAEDDTEAYCEPRDQVFIRASAGDDYIGVQTYTRGRIKAGGEPLVDPAVPRTLTGWEYYPAALGGAVRRVSRLVPETPIVVTENGLATRDDAQRVEYTSGALRSLRQAMNDGADVRGYFHWSLLDNWEWGRWEPTFGLVAVDRATFARTPKPSLRWLGGLAPRRP